MWDDPQNPVVRPFKEEREEDKAPPDPRLEFFAEYRGGRGHTAGRPERAHMPWNVCHHVDGKHACHLIYGRCPKDQEARESAQGDIAWRSVRYE